MRITVMLGGPSAEREVSLRSGAAVAKALRSIGHSVDEVDPKDATWKLPHGTEVVFLALHGTYGEDGQIQAQLEKLRMPYTGCDPEASRLAFDKVATKERCVKAGVPTPRYLVMEKASAPFPAGWQPPVVLKPVCQGSSVGLQFVEDVADWPRALKEAFNFDKRVLMEEKITGREVTVGILADQALPLAEVRVKQGIFDYKNKYTPGASEVFCPADIEPAQAKSIQDVALKAFRAIGGRDYARVDVMVSKEGQPYVLEVNNLPGMTELSIFPKAAAAAGIAYPQLCQRMIDLALQHPRTS